MKGIDYPPASAGQEPAPPTAVELAFAKAGIKVEEVREKEKKRQEEEATIRGIEQLEQQEVSAVISAIDTQRPDAPQFGKPGRRVAQATLKRMRDDMNDLANKKEPEPHSTGGPTEADALAYLEAERRIAPEVDYGAVSEAKAEQEVFSPNSDPIESVVPERIVDMTPREQKKILERLLEKANIKERAERAKMYLTERAKNFPKEIEKLGERYNALPLKYKIGITAALVAGVSATSVAAPIASVGFSTALYTQRALGAVGSAKQMEQWKIFAAKSGVMKKVLSYGLVSAFFVGGSSVAYGGTHLLNEVGLGGWVDKFFAQFGTPANAQEVMQTTESVVQDATPIREALIATEEPTTPTPEVPAEVPAPETATTSPAEDSSTIEPIHAKEGRGYEWMLKRMWEQLEAKGLGAEEYPLGSDARILLEADADSIDGIVHEMAKAHEVFTDGASKLIKLEDVISIKDGNIQLNGEGVAEAVGSRDATPPYPQPEVEAAPPAVAAEVPEPVEGVSAESETPVAEVETDDVPTSDSSVPVEEIRESSAPNRYGVQVSYTAPHIYTDKEGHLMAFGGSEKARGDVIAEYLKKNPGKIVYGASDDSQFRLAFGVVEGGRVEPVGEPVQNSLLGRLFGGDKFMKAPEPNEFRKLVQ
jgi:hypothetical protein